MNTIPNGSRLNSDEILAEIKADRNNWRFLMIPQLAFLFLLVLTLSIITVGGFYISVSSLWEGGDISIVEKSAKVFLTGSSSVLGFILIKIFGLLKDAGASFIFEEKSFTSSLNMVRLAADGSDLREIMSKYHKLS